MNLSTTSLVVLALLLSACAITTPQPTPADVDNYERVENTGFQRIATATTAAEKDRLAILAMQGDYRVDFSFAETVPLKAGYERHEDKNTGGYETVIVVRDTPNEIVLQHILVSPGGHVIKHWRQDWTFEANERFEFSAHQEWSIREIDAGLTAGAWTQCVFEVSDAPRYCGTGKWNHRYGVSTWTSDRTWRPLPRREYTKRSDYNAINAENRHTITPHGWTHEQDNTKTLRDGTATQETLVREFGFNDYRSIEGFDFEPAGEYWAKTADYWARVRDAWTARMQSGSTLRLLTEVDGMPIIVATFEQADNVESTTPSEQEAAIATLLDEWSETDQLVSSRLERTPDQGPLN